MLTVCENKDQVKQRLEIMAIYARQMSSYALDLADLVDKRRVRYSPYSENPEWMVSRINQLEELAGKIDGIMATI